MMNEFFGTRFSVFIYTKEATFHN